MLTPDSLRGKRVLIVHHEFVVAQALADFCRGLGAEVLAVEEVGQVHGDVWDLVFVAADEAAKNGGWKAITDSAFDSFVVVLVAGGVVSLKNLSNIDHFLEEPFSATDIRTCIESALEG